MVTRPALQEQLSALVRFPKESLDCLQTITVKTVLLLFVDRVLVRVLSRSRRVCNGAPTV
jgi:hypothetical protein